MQSGLSSRRPAETTNESSDESDQEDDDDENQEEEEIVTFPPPAPVNRDKRPVIFSGTFPIDRPLVNSSIGPARQRPLTSQLMVKRPRTFAIDEPIREEQIAEVWVVAPATLQ